MMNDLSSDTGSPLVSGEWLADHLDDPNVRIIEVTARDEAPDYDEGHVPGALWWYWKDAVWHETDREFPTPEDMAARLGRIGIATGATIVLYGDPVQYGTYAFWVLTMCGVPGVRLLDGGRKGWIAAGRPLVKEIPEFAPAEFKPGAADRSSRVGRDDIRDNLGRTHRLLLDVRSPEEYHGERVRPRPNFDHGAERAGRIPGAVHLFFRNFVNEDDTFKSKAELSAILEEAGAAPGKAGEIVTYCRLSHRATLAWFAMRYLAGYGNVRVYDGSWTEWGSIVGFPVEK